MSIYNSSKNYLIVYSSYYGILHTRSYRYSSREKKLVLWINQVNSSLSSFKCWTLEWASQKLKCVRIVVYWRIMTKPSGLCFTDHWYIKLGSIRWATGIIFKGDYNIFIPILVFKQKYWHSRIIRWNTKLKVEVGLSVLKKIDMKKCIRQGKLNSQFIVTARMDFQIFPKIFRFQMQYSKCTVLWAPPLDRSNWWAGPRRSRARA